jgi:hypothetical protein
MCPKCHLDASEHRRLVPHAIKGDDGVTRTMIFDEADSDACGLMADDLYAAACVSLTADRDRLRGEVERLRGVMTDVRTELEAGPLAFLLNKVVAALTAKEEK